MTTELIVSLDNLSMDYALQLAEKAAGKVWGFKVNDLLLHYGAEIIYELRSFGKVMADPKLYDIPNTMHNSIQCLKTAGANIITIHCASGYSPRKGEAEILAGVTVLTSMSDFFCENLYETNDRSSAVGKLLSFNDYGYTVCSVGDLIVAKWWEKHHVKDEPLRASLVTTPRKMICPGIRPAWYQVPDDQLKTATPRQAASGGADLIVIGRPLVDAEDFSEALERTLEELENLNVE